MRQRIAGSGTLVALACAISACNSTDAMYQQGPWGPSHVRRSYPEYSAPWGGKLLAAPHAANVTIHEAHTHISDNVAPAYAVRREISFEAHVPHPPIGNEPIGMVDPARSAVEPASSAFQMQAATTETQPTPTLQSSPPGVFTAPRRASSYAGNWTASVGGSTCKVRLSSVPSLDLYRATTQGCSHAEISQVNGWSFREDRMVLFARGQPVAHLSGAEASLAGRLNGSGAEIRLSR